jgi:glycosyltransferase involved in cell wall biosynthesis
LFESLSNLGYSVKVLLLSSEDRAIRRDKLFIRAFRVKKWLPAITLIRLYLHFLSSALKERELAVMIVDWRIFPVLLPVTILRRPMSVMLNLSRPVGIGGILGRIHFLQFRVSLMLAGHLVDVISAVSPFEAEELSRLGDIPKAKMVVIPSPLDRVFTDYEPTVDKNCIRRKLGIGQLIDKKIVLYHGVLEESRGITTVVATFAKAFQGSDDVVLLLVGNGTAKQSVQAMIRQERLRNCVVMGPVPYLAVPEIISASDLGLVVLPDNPWWRYQCPTKLIELLAMRKRVVASDLPAIRWVGQDSELITYVRKLDAEELKAAITTSLGRDRTACIDTRSLDRFKIESLASELDSIIREKHRKKKVNRYADAR